jgi:abnormal spindle-like microcephaly-associated protein
VFRWVSFAISRTAGCRNLLPASILKTLGLRAAEAATRLSKACAIKLVDDDAVHIILRLIQSCNRSTPHMELLKSALNVIKNLCKHRITCAGVFEVADSVDILVELMQMNRDKHDIFLKACGILKSICKVSAQRKVR